MITNNNNWIADFQRSLQLKKIIAAEQIAEQLPALKLLTIENSRWLTAIKVATEYELRFASIWAQEKFDHFEVNAVFEHAGSYLLLRTQTELAKPTIASITPLYPAADRLERHAHDLLSIVFTDHPNFQRWTRHKAWSENEFPLRHDFVDSAVKPRNDRVTPPDNDYQFLQANGASICEIPVGPIHAGIIEPGHFRFQIAGEDVINLEEHLGYVHKGIEKIAIGRTINQLLRLAGRVSGDSTVAHTWATAQACERAGAIEIPTRAAWLRAIMLERERIANHLGDIGALCNDVAFSFGFYQFSRLHELWLRNSAKVFGHRLMMDKIVFGGVAQNINLEHIELMEQEIYELHNELAELYPALNDSSSLQDRLQTTGILTAAIAKQLGTLGYVGRASGIKFDVRKYAAYLPYNELEFQVPVLVEGDCAARMQIRMQEILESLKLLQQLLEKLPAGKIRTESNSSPQAGEGVGIIESWRGEILTYVNIDQNGLIKRFFPRDPSWFAWPALELLIDGNIAPDFPVCNKSVNGSYSGVDL
jgi:Ni,Fe-hydrogenase III large subunit/NADH:ubiquinone oxidoreductase subunit C